jgi:hypothetical protein
VAAKAEAGEGYTMSPIVCELVIYESSMVFFP